MLGQLRRPKNPDDGQATTATTAVKIAAQAATISKQAW